jgi:hypothetical protein
VAAGRLIKGVLEIPSKYNTASDFPHECFTYTHSSFSNLIILPLSLPVPHSCLHENLVFNSLPEGSYIPAFEPLPEDKEGGQVLVEKGYGEQGWVLDSASQLQAIEQLLEEDESGEDIECMSYNAVFEELEEGYIHLDQMSTSSSYNAVFEELEEGDIHLDQMSTSSSYNAFFEQLKEGDIHLDQMSTSSSYNTFFEQLKEGDIHLGQMSTSSSYNTFFEQLEEGDIHLDQMSTSSSYNAFFEQLEEGDIHLDQMSTSSSYNAFFEQLEEGDIYLDQMSTSPAIPKVESRPAAAAAVHPCGTGVTGSRIPRPPQSAPARGGPTNVASRTESSRLPAAPSAPVRQPTCASAGARLHQQRKPSLPSQKAARVQLATGSSSNSRRSAAVKASTGVVANPLPWR